MGIRFLCYHCEKRLNVKENQAGQQGRCPKCLSIVLIPEKSTIPNELEKQKSQEGRPTVPSSKSDSFVGLHNIDEQVTLEGLPAESRDAEQVVRSAAANPVVKKIELSDSSSSEMFLLSKPELPETLGQVDPIAQSPKSIWYFRSRELGEKGPLKGKVMQEHVDQGNVKIGCIVWREDWDDWVPAEKVFPSLAEAAKAKRKKQKVNRAFKDANYKIPDEINPHSELYQRRRKKALIFWSLIAAGIVIISLLTIVLIQLVTQ